jgi:hypothetical protein
VPRAARLAVGAPAGGAPAPGGVDLGTVPAAAAAAYLLDLAARDELSAHGRLVLGAVIADSSVVWPRLLVVARDPRVRRATRREATHWASRAACDAVKGARGAAARADTAGRDVRKQVVFALSQHLDGAREAALTRAARADRDPEVRCAALFWLGQADGASGADARALALYEEVLRGR